MTSAPPPAGSGWNFQQDEPHPNADPGREPGTKPRHTGLLLTLGILIGLLVVGGASAGLLYAATGSYLPGTLTSDAAGTPSPAPASSESAGATPSPTPTTEHTTPPAEPAEPSDQAIAFQSEPEPAWQVDGSDLFNAAELDVPQNAPVQFIRSTPATPENVSGLQAVQSWTQDTRIVAGINVESGAVLWTHTSTGSDVAYGPDACFNLDGGDIIACATSAADDGGSLLFLTAATGKVLTETDWDADVRIIAGSPENLFVGGITDKAGLYLAHGTSSTPDSNWSTETIDDLVAATELWHLALSFDDAHAQFTLNSHALLVDVSDGAQVRVVADGYADVRPGIGALVSDGWTQIEVIDGFTAEGSLWQAAGRSATARPVLGIGRTLYDASSGAPLWELPSIAQTDDETQSISLLPKQVIRVLDQGGPSGNSQAFGYDARTGEEVWSRQTDRMVVHTAWEDIAIALTYSHFTPKSVLAFNSGTGAELWEVDLPKPGDEDVDLSGPDSPVRFVGSTLLIAGSSQITGLVAAS